MAVSLFHKHYPCSTSSRTAIIVHGLFGMLDNWHNIAQQLSKKLNVVSVDCRNHGNSPHTPEMSYKLMAEDLTALCSDLSISEAIFIGHSMGGKVVMQLAHDYPAIVQKLIVVDIAPKAYKPGHLTYFEAFNAIDFSELQSRSEADRAFAQYEDQKGVRQFLLKNLDRAKTGFKLKMNVSAIENFYTTLIGPLEFNTTYKGPSLFVAGAKSNYILKEDEVQITQHFSDATFVTIENAGHWVHAENPVQFLEAIDAFID